MVGAATWLYTVLGAAVVAVGLLLALALPALIHLHGAFGRLARPLAILTALDVGISVVAIAPIAVLRGLQRFPIVNAINGAGALVGVALTIAMLQAGAGIVGVAATGFITEQDHPRAGRFKTVATPVKLEKTPGTIRSPAPLLGEHSRDVLAEAGFTPDEIESLAARRII